MWIPDKDFDPELLPKRVNDETYESVIIDPNTGLARGDKPWFTFFYWKECGISQNFKPWFEIFSNKLQNISNFAMIDVIESEKLKETFYIKTSPFFGLFKNGSFYQYDGARSFDSIVEFIEKGHLNLKKDKVRPIPRVIGPLGLQLRYVERTYL